MKFMTIPNETRAQIIAMARAGSHRNHIAKRCGRLVYDCSRSILKAEGIKAVRAPTGGPTKILLTRSEIAHQFKNGSKQTEIAARAGVSRERIRQILNKEIPDLDGSMNMRRYPKTRECEICWGAVCRGEPQPQSTGDYAGRRASPKGSAMPPTRAPSLRARELSR